MDRFEMFRDLMIMAAADRKFTEEEVEFLALRANRWGLTDEQFDAAVRSATQGERELTIPEAKEERVELVRDLLRVMAADGELADVEKRLFARAAARMEISSDQLNRLIDGLL